MRARLELEAAERGRGRGHARPPGHGGRSSTATATPSATRDEVEAVAEVARRGAAVLRAMPDHHPARLRSKSGDHDLDPWPWAWIKALLQPAPAGCRLALAGISKIESRHGPTAAATSTPGATRAWPSSAPPRWTARAQPSTTPTAACTTAPPSTGAWCHAVHPSPGPAGGDGDGRRLSTRSTSASPRPPRRHLAPTAAATTLLEVDAQLARPTSPTTHGSNVSASLSAPGLPSRLTLGRAGETASTDEQRAQRPPAHRTSPGRTRHPATAPIDPRPVAHERAVPTTDSRDGPPQVGLEVVPDRGAVDERRGAPPGRASRRSRRHVPLEQPARPPRRRRRRTTA